MLTVSEIVSDKHRFGKKVTRVQMLCAGRAYLNKPRSILLEKLFLDSSSPIAGYLNQLYPFIGDYYSKNNWESYCIELEIKPFVPCSNKQIKFASHSFGKFGALSLTFGFTDLHRDNCLYILNEQKPFFYSIDLETAFYPVNSLFDTGLIANGRPEGQDISGYLSNTNDEFRLNGPEVLDGFIEFWLNIKPNRTKLINYVYDQLLDSPVRVILRDTKIYRESLDNKDLRSKYNFTPEEIVQLEVGDIPYFFCYLKNPSEVFYFSSQNKKCKVEDSSLTILQFRKLLERNKAIDESRQLTLFKIGAAQIVKHFIDLRLLPSGKNYALERINPQIFRIKTPECDIDFKI